MAVRNQKCSSSVGCEIPGVILRNKKMASKRKIAVNFPYLDSITDSGFSKLVSAVKNSVKLMIK